MLKDKKPLKIFLYISIWVMIWGSVASLIDYPLLKNSIYEEGDIGQYITFSLTAIISILSAKNIFNKFNL